MRRLVVLTLLFCVNLITLSLCQSAAPTYSLSAIKISGSKLYAELDVITTTGLKPGTRVTADDLRQAADRLSKSGVFKQVSFQFDGRTATFAVVDADQLIPAYFENFIWLSDAELITQIHESVALFSGRLPVTGTLTDQVSAALDSILKQRRIQGHVVAAPSPASGLPTAIEFRVEGVNIKVSEIDFPGAAADRLVSLQTATKKIIGSSYLRSATPSEIKRSVQPVYGKLGFLKTQFGAPKLSIAKDDPAAPEVAIEVPVQEGPQYNFASADWNGNSAISALELAKLIELKPGSPADTTQLARSIATAKELYGIRGYMDAQVKSTATLDSDHHTAIFHLEAVEGPLYHMGKLEVQNLDERQAETVRRVWELHEGDVYDSSYPKSFLKKHPHELPFLIGWGAVYTQTIHDDTRVVDLVMKFQKMQEASQ